MRLTGSRVYYRPSPPRMPTGLVQLMEGMTREVLKHNPTDIYGFCAGHVQQLLEMRDGPLRKKSLSLEEKIARAQEKVRQRAEKRRQQYDNDMLLRCSGSAINDTSNDTESLLIQKPTAVIIPKTQIIHEQELVNSSEIEFSHEPDIDTSAKIDANPQVDIDTENNDLKNDSTSESILTENNIKNVTLEATNVINESHVTTDPLPKTKSEETVADLLHELSKNDNPMMVDEQTTNDCEPKTQETSEDIHNIVSNDSGLHEIKDDGTSDYSSSLENESAVDFGENILKNTVSEEGDVNKDVSLIPDNHNSLTQTVSGTVNDVLPIKSDTINQPNNVEETQTQQSVNDKIIENFDIEINTEANTITLCFKESPALELQSPLINSGILESLPVTNTDSETATLTTQNSIDDEIKHDAFKNDCLNLVETDIIVQNPQGSNKNIETTLNISNDDQIHTNTQQENQVITIDEVNTSIIAAVNVNDDIENNKSSTSRKNSASPQISNQDSNMDLETAAITIQKVFRTFLFKSRTSTFEDSGTDETNFIDDDDKTKVECEFPVGGLNMDRRPHGITRMDTVLQTVNEEKSLSLSTDDSSTLSSAATVIQAHVRGFLVRNKLNSNKTISTNSLAASNSNEPSLTSLETDNDQNKNKTKLNIHIVPEGGNYLSRDESLITSMDLSLDSSPPSSINLHPLGYDKSERRKQLKREDAIQSISPPSNNSGKLSEDVDSVKELPPHDQVAEHQDSLKDDTESVKIAHVENGTFETNTDEKEKDLGNTNSEDDQSEINLKQNNSLSEHGSDEMDVVSPFIPNEDKSDIKLMHSGEFHDAVLPTKVSRSDTSVASGE